MAEVEVKGDYFGYETFYDTTNKKIVITLLERDRMERILEENGDLRSRNMELEEALDDARGAAKTILKVTGGL